MRAAIAPVTKGAARAHDYGRRRSAEPPADMIRQGWVRYIKDEIKQSERTAIDASMRAVAQVLGKDVVAAEKEIAALREQVATLTAELAELKDRDTDRQLRAVPAPTVLIA